MTEGRGKKSMVVCEISAREGDKIHGETKCVDAEKKFNGKVAFFSHE